MNIVALCVVKHERHTNLKYTISITEQEAKNVLAWILLPCAGVNVTT